MLPKISRRTGLNAQIDLALRGIDNHTHVKRSCPCGPEMEPPIYGRFRSFFDPDKLTIGIKPHKTKAGVKLPPILQATEVRKVRNHPVENVIQEESFLQSRHKVVPIPEPSIPHNIMWEPKVRRGPTLVHFATLEKNACKFAMYQQARNKNRKIRANRNDSPFINAKTGAIEYPSIKVARKQELTDYSMFLEETEDQVLEYKTMESQTELDAKNQHLALCELREVMPKHSRTREGKDEETQVDLYRLSQAMHRTVNPRMHTINRIAKIIANKTIDQSLLEVMECAELETIHAEREQIEFRMKVIDRQEFSDKRNYCKTYFKRLQRQKEDEELEERLKIVEDRIMKRMFAQKYIAVLIERGFHDFVREGVIPNPEIRLDEARGLPGVLEWLHKTFEIGGTRTHIAKNMLDDIIEVVANGGGVANEQTNVEEEQFEQPEPEVFHEDEQEHHEEHAEETHEHKVGSLHEKLELEPTEREIIELMEKNPNFHVQHDS